MRIGIIGLGRMGAAIARRLMRAGHETVVWDRDAAAIASLVPDGAAAATSSPISPISWAAPPSSG